MRIFKTAPLTATQRLNQLADPHYDPVPRDICRIIAKPDGPEITTINWETDTLPHDLRIRAKVKAIKMAQPALDLLADFDWLNTLSHAGRKWVIDVTRDAPRGMALLLADIRDAGIGLREFYDTYVRQFADEEGWFYAEETHGDFDGKDAA